tara:strand:- start:2769 stop:4976 length:2208 start_codon:yes stop_codon:yes gene_type:complete
MSLYDDAVMISLPTGASGNKDGTLYNLKPEEKVKPTELVTNGDFSNGLTSWLNDETHAHASVTHSNGRVHFEGTTHQTNNYVRIKQDNVFEIGKRYRVAIEVDIEYADMSATDDQLGGVKFGHDPAGNGGSNLDIGAVIKSGRHVFYFTANETNLNIARHTNSATGAYKFSIGYISVKEVEKEPADFSIIRGSNLSATRIDSAGLLEKGRTNRVKYNNTFTNAAWQKNNVSVTAVTNVSGYDGTKDVFKLERTGGAPHLFQSVTASDVVQTWSFYAKQGNVPAVVCRFDPVSGSAIEVIADLTDGSRLSGGLFDASIGRIGFNIEQIGSAGGWYRVSVTGDANINVVKIFPALADGSVADTNGQFVYIQKAQLEDGLVPTTCITTTGRTLSAGLDEDEPRFDYTGAVGGCPTMLMEPTRVNLVKNSEYLGDYTTSNATITTNALTSPEGLDNATTINVTSNSGSIFAQSGSQVASVTASTKYTFSFYVKQGTNTENYLAVRDQNAEAFISEDVAYTASPSEWRRIEHTFTTPVGCTSVRLYPSRYDSGGQGTTHLFGIQLEEGAFATSYIPNHGLATVTRTRDNSNGLLLDDYMDGEDVTVFLEMTNNDDIIRDDSAANFMISSNGSNLGALRVYRPSSTSLRQLTFYSQDNEGNVNPATYEITTASPKIAFKRIFETGRIQLFTDGAERRDAINVDMDKLTRIDIKGQGGKCGFKQIIVWNRILTDQECVSLTS